MSYEHTNALIHESSPYLLQHAHNPVDWHPWGDEAFEKAKAQNKLVLVSVGYSACHWCHVMEHETFEDSAAAAIMNENFINIKVDREERPDVDQVYMTAVQLMTRRGGWPLNCFTLPDGRPIYGGTYFPKDQWINILEDLVEKQKSDPKMLEDYAERLTEGIQMSELVVRSDQEVEFQTDTIHALVNHWKNYWDIKKGGPNRAPKFPLPNNFEFLLQYGYQLADEPTQEYVATTLTEMARGGIYDQIGGGFARYSVDAEWKVPHFEKMLYDNAQLVSLYSQAFQADPSEEYARVVKQTIVFLEREMKAPSGIFYSALDADSEGEEGKFYVWSQEELQTLLEQDWEWVKDYYNVNSNGKWEGHYILLRADDDQKFAEKQGLTLAEFYGRVDQVNEKLLAARAGRI
ncbi:MAG: thioredoxin domain-containing protein, partial [Flavobacteriales bacterium]|nr:thioredoxin domain-containing protein [Flavobacteriales bacterium]